MDQEFDNDLFESSSRKALLETAPLAFRMRPQDLDELAGQSHIIAPGRPLRVWIDQDRVPSLLFWGPSGCGKTTLAQLIAKHTYSHFVTRSAVMSGVKDIKEVIEKAGETQKIYSRKTILFLDEIHRFNKAQQDVLLPHVESGLITLIGATTENPSFEVNSALLSRLRVLVLKPLSEDELMDLLRRALNNKENGLGGELFLEDESLKFLASIAGGDARRGLTLLESLSFSTTEKKLSLEKVKDLFKAGSISQPIQYDKNGEEHFNVISAFIKSLRDSDPHASLYYLARLIEGGEDPKFIVRRLIVFASEDIGNADPRALMIAVAAKDAVDFVGLPECRINLAQAVTYLSLAPKSNASYEGIENALKEVKETGALAVPLNLRNAVSAFMKNIGYGKGYQYAHQNEKAKVKQKRLPDGIKKKRFYFPKKVGFESNLFEKLSQLESFWDH